MKARRQPFRTRRPAFRLDGKRTKEIASIAREGLVPELISDTLKEDFDLKLYTDVNL